MEKFVIKNGKRPRPTDALTESMTKKKKAKEELGTPKSGLQWKKLTADNLNCDYVQLLSRTEADELFQECEKSFEYNKGKLAQVHLFGKWLDIPRQQVAHGDPGLSYTFSNNTVPARSWTPLLTHIKKLIVGAVGWDFNFVLINRYKDGHDYIGAHKDDEKDLVPEYPIASLSLGQPRDFVFKHQDARGKMAKYPNIQPVKILLEHGSLLLMNHPTNSYWYHSLPQRKKLRNVRINMTFRKMNPEMCKPVTLD